MAEAATGDLGEAGTRQPLRPLPDEAEVLARASGENFSVASLLLPRRLRRHLMAIYGYARLVDQLGDAVEGDRLAALAAFESDVNELFRPGGRPRQPVLVALAPTVREFDLPARPFLDLVEANRLDQVKKRYESFEELLAYCALSANPVGELVLRVFEQATPERISRSDEICTALQLAEHWQDVAEDFAAGRVYLPADDLRRFGVGDAELAAAHTGPALARALAFEVARARALLDRGAPLVGSLRGAARLAVSGYLAGGRAALEAIERAGYDVLAGPPRGRRLRRLRLSLAAYRRGT